jgi:hypothetical protein
MHRLIHHRVGRRKENSAYNSTAEWYLGYKLGSMGKKTKDDEWREPKTRY